MSAVSASNESHCIQELNEEIIETPAKNSGNKNKETPAKNSGNENKETPAKNSGNENKETPAKNSGNENKETPAKNSVNENTETPAKNSGNERIETPAENSGSENIQINETPVENSGRIQNMNTDTSTHLMCEDTRMADTSEFMNNAYNIVPTANVARHIEQAISRCCIALESTTPRLDFDSQWRLPALNNLVDAHRHQDQILALRVNSTSTAVQVDEPASYYEAIQSHECWEWK
ncbi:hypothetical protein BDZ91DRAFT_795370 [Kalaharituber pfeilii]|nr:hypothetical protein BDZ91DRAFT_795370 [Kalaharituber pfeilii]